MGDIKGKAGGKDAKDKGKPPAKGTTPADDSNVPKNIEIEYPEVPEEPDILIMEKNFQNAKKPAV